MKHDDTQRIDWDDIHRRQTAAQESLARGWSPTPEEKKNILRKRAKKLARESSQLLAEQGRLNVVVFTLAYETYAVEATFVREVYPLKDFTPLPGTPPFVWGILNVRGQILSLIDLKKFFDLPEKGLTDLDKVIILRTDKMEFGIAADSVVGVRSILPQDIQPSLPTLGGIREKYLRGVTTERIVILDAMKLLTDDNLIVRDTV